MREIKFRLWNSAGKHSKMFYDVFQVSECLKQQLLYDSGAKSTSAYNHIGDGSSFMQFIEKKDIKGRDAYDGDIVKYKSISCDGISYGTAFIKYVDGIPKLQVIDCAVFKSGSIIHMAYDFEIIGNIYEKGF